jgi:ribosomal protein S14
LADVNYEERFHALVSATSDVIYQKSPDWSEMRSLKGRNFIADTDDPNRSWLDRYIYPDDQPYVMAKIRETIRTKRVFQLEHRIRRQARARTRGRQCRRPPRGVIGKISLSRRCLDQHDE